MHNTILHGDALAMLATLPDGSVQTCVTSPPYFGLRDYGVAGQIGMEPTPAEYVARLVAVFAQVRRCLRDDGTLWLNLGDSYATHARGHNGFGSSTLDKSAQAQQATTGKHRRGDNRLSAPALGMKDKDLLMMPARVALALQDDGWYLRAECVWAKPNPMPESVTDRPTRAHEMVYLLAKQSKYFYDAAAIKEPLTRPEEASRKTPAKFGGAMKHAGYGTRIHSGNSYDAASLSGRNRRDVWTVSAEPYPGAHFAVMPTKLVEPCILAGSRPYDTVLDPFFGAGTVGYVAKRLGRRYIGCELNVAYITLAEKRLRAIPDEPLLTA